LVNRDAEGVNSSSVGACVDGLVAEKGNQLRGETGRLEGDRVFWSRMLIGFRFGPRLRWSDVR
jgi:hypothetical protein